MISYLERQRSPFPSPTVKKKTKEKDHEYRFHISKQRREKDSIKRSVFQAHQPTSGLISPIHSNSTTERKERDPPPLCAEQQREDVGIMRARYGGKRPREKEQSGGCT